MNKSLIFIDTNIFLDFYRTRGFAADLAILKRMDANLGRFVTTSQVEMEFKKNRSNEIVKLYDSLKQQDWSGLQLPVETGPVPPYLWAAFVLSGDWR